MPGLLSMMALEEDGQLNNGLELEDLAIPEIEENMLGISAAIENISTLFDIRDILNKSGKNTDKAAIRLAQIACENISASTKIIHEPIVVSMESIEQGNVAIEGVLDNIGNFIAKIWKAIVDTFKALWKKISEFIFDTKEQAVKTAHRTENIVKSLEDLTKKAGADDVSKNITPIEALPLSKELADPFRFLHKELNKDLEPKDLINFIDSLLAINNEFVNLVHQSEQLSLVFRDIVDGELDFANKEGSYSLSKNQFQNAIGNAFDMGFIAFIESSAKSVKFNELDKASIELIKEASEGDTFKMDSIRQYGPMIYGGRILYFTGNVKKYFEVIERTDINISSDKTVIPMLDCGDVQDFAIKANELCYRILDYYAKEYETKYKSTKKAEINMLARLDLLLKKIDPNTNSSEETRNLLFNIKTMADYMFNVTAKISFASGMLFKSGKAVAKLADFYEQTYKKALG